MHYFTNHSWCSDSNWGGNYDCRYIVTIKRIPKNGSYHDKPTQDWLNCIRRFDRNITVEEIEDKKNKLSNRLVDKNEDEINEYIKRSIDQETFSLNDHIIEWLNSNIKDRKGEDINKGWCIGSEKYNTDSSISFSVFFHRKKDAMLFIKTFGVHGKPETYFDYFKDVKKELDLRTLKLVTVQNFS